MVVQTKSSTRTNLPPMDNSSQIHVTSRIYNPICSLPKIMSMLSDSLLEEQLRQQGALVPIRATRIQDLLSDFQKIYIMNTNNVDSIPGHFTNLLKNHHVFVESHMFSLNLSLTVQEIGVQITSTIKQIFHSWLILHKTHEFKDLQSHL